MPWIAAIVVVCLFLHSGSIALAEDEPECLLEMPFESFAGVILVRLTVAESPPLSFIVDSGASMSAITDPLLADALGLEIGESGLARGVGAGATQVFITGETTIRSHGFAVLDTQLAAHDIGARLEQLFGRNIDGFLGFELFDRYVVEIDPARRMVALHDPQSFSYDGDGEVLPLEVVDQRPVISATVLVEADKKPIEVSLMVDSGSARYLTLVTGSKRRLKAPANRSSSGSVGVSGTIEVDVAPIEELQIGAFRVLNVESSFIEPYRVPAVRNIPDLNGVLGNGLLSRFRSFFDYGNRRLILEPLGSRSE